MLMTDWSLVVARCSCEVCCAHVYRQRLPICWKNKLPLKLVPHSVPLYPTIFHTHQQKSSVKMVLQALSSTKRKPEPFSSTSWSSKVYLPYKTIMYFIINKLFNFRISLFVYFFYIEIVYAYATAYTLSLLEKDRDVSAYSIERCLLSRVPCNITWFNMSVFSHTFKKV